MPDEEIEITTEAPEGADVIDVEAGPEGSDLEGQLLSQLEGALEGDKAARVEGGPPAPGTPEARAQARLEKARAAEAARVERRRESSKVEEAERIIRVATQRAQELEAQYAQRMARAEALEAERQEKLDRFKADVAKGGLEALAAHGLDYDTLVAQQLDRDDPNAIAKSAAQEVAELKRMLREREEADQRAQAQAREAEYQQRIAQAEHQDRLALVGFAEEAQGVPPQVSRLAKAARSNRAAAKLFIETADEIKEAYNAEVGRNPTLREVVDGLDKYLDFLQDGRQSNGAGQAAAHLSSQAARHQRTLGSPEASSRNPASRRELTQEEQDLADIRALNQALASERGF